MDGHDWIELDERTDDGLEVRLLWRRAEGAVAVEVFDTRSGTSRACEVPARRASDAFRHPFVYLAAAVTNPGAYGGRRTTCPPPAAAGDVDELWVCELASDLLAGLGELLARPAASGDGDERDDV
jgi:hypothetical protein